ncbi:MAG: translocation/assembly module TamB [Rhodothermia bacterium]|nr:translocation/assembly module TamB [Rhodothermia bacterium]
MRVALVLPFRFLFHIPRGVVRLLLWSLVVFVVLLVAATRTQVGRDVLKDRVEREFANRFSGHLEIGQLTGNILYRVAATDVAVFDSVGTRVLSIDSVVVRPRWRRIAQGRLEFGRLYLFGPRAFLARDSTGSWSLASAFRPLQPSDSTTSTTPLQSVAVGDLRVVSGEITTTNAHDRPEAVTTGTIFDYTNSNVGIRNAQVTVDWRPGLTQVDVLGLSARLANPVFDVTTLQGQVVVDQGSFLLNRLRVETPVSVISGDASYHPDKESGQFYDSLVDLNLNANPIDLSELHRVLPSMPLRSTIAVHSKVRGPLSALVVEEVSLSTGPTTLAASGTVVGLPDSIDYEISVSEGTLHRRTMQRLFPAYDIAQASNADSVTLSVLGRGVLREPLEPKRSGFGDFFLDVSSTAGQLSGRVSLAKDEESALTLTSDLVANRFDVGKAVPGLGVSAVLTGDISIDGGGNSKDDLVASVELDLVGSTIWDRAVDSLRALASYTPENLTAEAFVVANPGTASARFAADLSGSPNRFALELSTDNIDAGPILRIDSLATRLNVVASARIEMADLDNVQGDIEVRFDSSTIALGETSRTVLPSETAVGIKNVDAQASQVAIRGDLAHMDVELRGGIEALRDVAIGWGGALRTGSTSESVLSDSSAGLAKATGEPPHLENPNVSVTVLVTRMDPRYIGDLLPGGPVLGGDLAGKLVVSASPEALAFQAVAGGDSLIVGALHAGRYSVDLNTQIDRDRPLSAVDTRLILESDWFSFGGGGIPDLSVRASTVAGKGQLTVTTGEGARIGPLTMTSALATSGGGLELTPSSFELKARETTWELAEPARIRLGPGSIHTDGLTLLTRETAGVLPQQIEVVGGVSPQPDAQLFARLERLDLLEVSNLLSLKEDIGGRLSGTLTLFKRESTPILESSLNIASFRLDERVLGDVDVTSQLQPGTSTVLLDVEVAQAADTSGTVVENRARIQGTLQLPTYDQFGSRRQPGSFDLQAAITRADMFFFEYIFPGTVHEVAGAVSGEAHITGSPSRPIFDAELALSNGEFLVPQFNLAMTLDGDVYVDEFGVHIRRADIIDKTGGRAVITGDVLFNDYRFFSLNLYGQLDEFQIMDVTSSRTLPFYGHIWGSGTASLSGPISAVELRASSVTTEPRSELYIPLVESEASSDGGFIIFADSTGAIPDLKSLTRRRNVLASRPQGERGFTEGMDIEINIDAPEGSTVHLVIDPLLGDVINGVGSGRVQILRKQGEFQTFGTFEVNSGDYLFTAGEVFVRRFIIEDGGLITWDGDPADALLDIPAAFRTRASRAGLGTNTEGSSSLIPVVVNLRITGRVSAPEVSLSLAVDRSAQDLSSSTDQEFLETILNDPQQSTEYATSVLLTNSFALTTTTSSGTEALGTGAFNSLSQLVATQLNRYLSSALPNVDFSFGVQGETGQELDITYGVALRLLDERLVIRGEGVYQGTESAANESLQGEFVVEVRINNNVSAEIFYRREGDALAAERILTSTTGVGVSYRTEFPTWRRVLNRLFGWLTPDRRPEPQPDGPVASNPPAAN